MVAIREKKNEDTELSALQLIAAELKGVHIFDNLLGGNLTGRCQRFLSELKLYIHSDEYIPKY